MAMGIHDHDITIDIKAMSNITSGETVLLAVEPSDDNINSTCTVLQFATTHTHCTCMYDGVLWPSGLVHWTQVLVLSECVFESRPGQSRHLCP